MRWITLAVWLCAACSTEHRGEPALEIQVLAACPVDAPTCVRMTLEDQARPMNESLPLGDSTGYANIALKVRGYFSGHEIIDTVLLVRSYTDGVACSTLGAATVAVTGFTDTGGPIVLTSAGPFTIDSSSLVFGCEACGVLLSEHGPDTVAVRRTPAWDLRSVGLEPEDLNYDDAQTVFVRTETSCVAMRVSGQFDAADRARCASMTELGNATRQVSDVTLKPAEWLYQATGQRLRFLLNSGACS